MGILLGLGAAILYGSGDLGISLTSTIIANNGVACSGGGITDGGTNMQFPGATCGGSITST